MSKKAIEIAAELAAHHEGLRLEPYYDPVGFPTIGYGHLLSRDKTANLSQWDTLRSEEAARDILEVDLQTAADSVSRLIVVPLEPEQEAALIDFAFNCGGGNLQASTLRRCVNREDHLDVPEQFKRWVYASKRKLPGLVRRRNEEAQLYTLGTSLQ